MKYYVGDIACFVVVDAENKAEAVEKAEDRYYFFTATECRPATEEEIQRAGQDVDSMPF